jgi:hypothetical protein
MDPKPDSKEPPVPEAQTEIDAIGAAGQTADPFVGRVVSGMPVGGPHDLGRRAADCETRAESDRIKTP